MAQAGEFTKQALVNGKLSLTEAEGVIAVSYTHLDVYKRQVLSSVLCSIRNLVPFAVAFAIPAWAV